MASRTLRAETMRTLWDTISLSKLYGSTFRGNCEEYKEHLQQMLNRPGAIKYTRYIVHPREKKMDQRTFDTLAQYCGRLIKERRHGSQSIPSTPTALKASVWLNADNRVECHVHQAFQWGDGDADKLLRRIESSYMHLLDFESQTRLTVYVPQLLESTLSDPVNITTLVDPDLAPEEMLFPAGVDLILHCEGLPDGDPRWSQLLFGALTSLHSLVMSGDWHEECGSQPKLVLECISKRGAAIFLKMLSDAIRKQPDYIFLRVQIVVSQNLTSEDFRELADTIVKPYIRNRGLLLESSTTCSHFTLFDASECRAVEVNLYPEEDMMEVFWSEEDLHLTYEG